MEIISTTPPAAIKESSSEDSSDKTDSEEERVMPDVEEDALVVGYLKTVTPEIAMEFQV